MYETVERASRDGGAAEAAHRLFFAVRPDEPNAAVAAAHGERLQKELRSAVHGRPLSAERMHVTLHWLGDYEELDLSLVQLAGAAAALVESEPFEVMFDRVGSLDAGGSAVVLKSSDRLVALRTFQRELGAAMQRAGLGDHIRRRFNPHMTMLYAGQAVPAQSIPPVRWTVGEFVLIDSLLGQTRHIVRGRWPLRGRQGTLGDW